MLWIWIATITSVVIVSLVSLVGVVFLALNEAKLKNMLFMLISVAVGALFGDAFLHLLPEAFKRTEDSHTASLAVLAGILLFFMLEKFLRWHHHHTVDDEHAIHPVGYMNLIADGVHNAIDGVLIGSSFLVSPQVGVATTIAVVLHEIPQEICDFAVLLHAGFSKRRAVLLNLASASLAIAGAVVALLVGGSSETFTHLMLPLTAGGFIYIAGSDLLPELSHDVQPVKSALQIVGIAVGVGLMYLLALLE